MIVSRSRMSDIGPFSGFKAGAPASCSRKVGFLSRKASTSCASRPFQLNGFPHGNLAESLDVRPLHSDREETQPFLRLTLADLFGCGLPGVSRSAVRKQEGPGAVVTDPIGLVGFLPGTE
jgi:hypothetical protein